MKIKLMIEVESQKELNKLQAFLTDINNYFI